MPPEKMEYGSTGRCDDVESELVRAAAAVQCIAASVRAASLPDTGAVRRDGGLTIVPLGRIPSLEKCPAVVLGSGGDTCSDASSSAFDETSALLKSDREEESWCAFLAQVFPSFILAGLGMVAAGLLLDAVQAWPAFVEASELFILVPALLGLKGNLEMTLASRLATQANLGKAESLRDIVGLAVGNMALLQCQSVVVGTLAALYAVVTSVALSNHVTLRAALLVLASSVATASAASLVLGGVMISVVLVARPLRINPDNVAIPIAAALGDLTTLGLLAVISAALFDLAESRWVSLGLVLALFVLLPAWTYVAYRTENTRGVLSYGWLPIVSAMLISSFAGNILDFAVRRYHSMAAFQPLMNAEAHERGSWLLVALVVPGHLIFMTLISLLKNGSVKLSALFVLFYNVAAILQVAVLLLATRRIVRFLWHRGMDPDSTAIPYVTALGDVLGTSFLAAVFALMTPLGVDTEL
ncbi:solute carrier family 41 member 1-like isoform X2 [Amblyomma americanum]